MLQEHTFIHPTVFNEELPTFTGKRKRNDSVDFSWAFKGKDLSSDEDLCGEDVFSLSQDDYSPVPKKRRENFYKTSLSSPGSENSKYVRLCQLLQHDGDLSREVILKAMEKMYPEQYHQWESLLLASDSPARRQLIGEMCSCKDVGIKVLFNIFNSWDYINNHPRGKQLWEERANTFETRFSNTIYRVLTKCKKVTKRNPFLLKSLQAALVYISHMLESMNLHRNLCYLLCIASCIEGRGRYHGRTSNNLSILLQSYRYMIEELGGKDLSSIPEAERKTHETQLIVTFKKSI